KVGAAVDEDRQQTEFLSDRTERGRVTAGDDTGEQVDLALELHAPKLFDIGVGSGGLVGGDRLDLALAEQSALGVDLLRRQDVTFVGGLAQHRGRAGEERHMPGSVRGIRDLAFGRLCRRFDQLRSGNEAGACEAGSAYRYAKCVEKSSAVHGIGFVHWVLPKNDADCGGSRA